ncbi:DUF1080 domain-containing protein [Bacteroidota bacterium]
MKNKTLLYIIIVLLLGAFTTVIGQDRRTMETKVADILAQIPVNDYVHRDKLVNEMILMGEDGIMAFCKQLVSPGTGDDTNARFALESLSKYVSQKNKETERLLCAKTYTKAIKEIPPWEIMEFLFRQLQFCGKDESVEISNKYLMHKMLGYPAARTLINIGSEKAKKALLKTLSENISEKQELLIPIVKALGALKCSAALPQIQHLTESQETDMRKTSLFALAEIADPTSLKLLSDNAKAAVYKNDITGATSSYLRYANNLSENGNKKLSIKIAKELYKKCKNPDQLYNKAASLQLLTSNLGFEAMSYLLKAIESEDIKYRGAALRLANDIKGKEATSMWLEKMAKLKPIVKAEVMHMLGERGDKTAIIGIKQYLSSSNQSVRYSAISSIAILDKQEGFKSIIGQLKAFPDDDVKKILLSVTGPDNINALVKTLDNMPLSSKALIIDVIAERKAGMYFDEVYSYCSDKNNDIKKRAIAALKDLADTDHLDKLIKLLLSIDNEKGVEEIQQAIVRASDTKEDKELCSQKLLSGLEKTNQKIRIIEILAEVGGVEALKTVTEYYKNGDTNIRKAAFNALANWNNYSASTALFNIINNKNEKEYHKSAFIGYVKQVSNAPVSDDQKLLLFRKVMAFAADNEDKKLVIKSVGNLKTFLSLIFIDTFLEDDAVLQEAAKAAIKIALPSDGKDNGFSGTLVYNLLNYVAGIIIGPESEYIKENILSYTDSFEDGGFTPIFNGEDLTGWQGLVENPISRAKMSKTELARKQKIADEKMKENWSVKAGAIWFNGKGNNLCTIKEYGDFELILDWRITKKGDSGIYLRGTPQVQIWDTSRVDVGAQVGSGGLYNNQKHKSIPLKVVDNPIGDWNTLRIIMIGESVTVYLNGELVVDNVIMENYWNRNIPIFEKGAIELQAHGSDLGFRNIYVREITTPEYKLSDEEIKEGFMSLFSGKDLSSWVGNKTDYVIEDGDIVIYPQRGGTGNLYTEKEYSDFNFRFEFLLTPGANNGLGIRAPLEGDAAYAGMELQILDNTASIYSKLQEYQYHGSVYGVIPAKRGFLKPVGEWNTEEVIVKGPNVKVILNGTVIVDGNIDEASKNGTIDHKEHPGLKQKKGHIGFLGHGSILRFRNIRIKEL